MTITHHLYLRQFGEAEWLSASELAAHQDHRLVRLLRHALETVPYYANRGLDAVITAQGIDRKRWNELPLMNAEKVLDHEVELRTLRVPSGHGDVYYRLGHHDGLDPVAVALTEFALMVEGCQRMRLYAWHEIDPTLPLARLADGSDDPREGPVSNEYWDRMLWALGIKGTRLDIDPADPDVAVLDILAGLRAHAVEADGMRIAGLARSAAGRGAGSIRFDIAIAANVSGRAALQSAVGTAFGARLAALRYCGEAGLIAVECPTGGAYHAMSDSMQLEVVDERGAAVAPGARGRVVVTPFYNFAMPLLRYDTGLTAVRLDPCQCGRSLLTIDDFA